MSNAQVIFLVIVEVVLRGVHLDKCKQTTPEPHRLEYH
jgi:hypothetical protein